MPNRHRGEIEADIGGARRRLVLTLGALAELEASFGADDLVALAERFGGGRLRASVHEGAAANPPSPQAAARA